MGKAADLINKDKERKAKAGKPETPTLDPSQKGNPPAPAKATTPRWTLKRFFGAACVFAGILVFWGGVACIVAAFVWGPTIWSSRPGQTQVSTTDTGKTGSGIVGTPTTQNSESDESLRRIEANQKKLNELLNNPKTTK